MIDLHCHILPGMDDGPESLNEAVAMCRRAATDGIRTIVATPHFKPGSYEFTAARITDDIDILTAELKNKGVEIRILPGAEVTVSPEMINQLKGRNYLTINNGQYFLAEFSPLSVPANWDKFLLSFLDAGLTPIIAHPERNAWFINHPEALAAAIRNGIMVQITATSITGDFGPEAQAFSIRLLKENLVHVIASDAHSANLRPPLLADAVDLAADAVGREKAEALVTSIPRAIVEDGEIPILEPVEYNPQAQVQSRNWLQRLGLVNF